MGVRLALSLVEMILDMLGDHPFFRSPLGNHGSERPIILDVVSAKYRVPVIDNVSLGLVRAYRDVAGAIALCTDLEHLRDSHCDGIKLETDDSALLHNGLSTHINHLASVSGVVVSHESWICY